MRQSRGCTKIRTKSTVFWGFLFRAKLMIEHENTKSQTILSCVNSYPRFAFSSHGARESRPAVSQLGFAKAFDRTRFWTTNQKDFYQFLYLSSRLQRLWRHACGRSVLEFWRVFFQCALLGIVFLKLYYRSRIHVPVRAVIQLVCRQMTAFAACPWT